MKKFILPLITTLLCVSSFIGCGNLKQVAITDKNNVTIKDSLVIRDSTRLVDSVIYVQIPREKVMEIISQIDTSKLETSLAKSMAYVDTNSMMIIHSLENKDTVIQERVVYQDRFITTTKTVYVDSIQVREVPVEVQIEKTVYPKTYWYLLGFFIIVVGIFIVRIYFKFKAI